MKGFLRRKFDRILAAVLAAFGIVAIALLGIPASAFAETQTPASSDNLWQNEYGWNWYHTVKSYLDASSDGGYDRVEWIDDALHVEHYDSSFSLVSGTTIDASTYTPTGATTVLWGGYFKGSEYRFVVTGQKNPNESDSVAVVRVTKYSLGWQYLGNVEFSGVDIYNPFDAGSLRMAESNGELWIHTCRTMYHDNNGIHHQANRLFRIRESDLAKLGSNNGVVGGGYSSHSFNQYIVADGGKIYSASHGDTYPRQIFATNLTPGQSANDYPFITFKGVIFGDNYTGATFDGFEAANNGASLIAVGTITDQDKVFADADHDDTSGSYNVWVGVMSTSNGKATVKSITSHAFEDSTTACSPVLVKVNENRFLLMWTDKQKSGYFERHGQVQYAFLDGEGNLTSSISSFDGKLSDCAPTVVGDDVVWYSTGAWKSTGGSWMELVNSAPTFYSLNTVTGKATVHKPNAPMYRLYNRWSGEHLFTTDESEYSHLASIGWTQEGVAWISSGWSESPVYRLYNPYSGDHFYTSNKAEYDHLGSIGWNQEGISFYSASSSAGKPIYRLFNRWLTQGTHLFTTDASEYSYLGSIGWNKEGVAFYGL